MSVEQADSAAMDRQWFRTVLGQYPTGVCVVTAMDPESGPAGMVVGSFTSVSLDPPLVAFFPDKSSNSWPRIRRAGAFCVNILGADQEDVCRTFASKTADKFAGTPVVQGVTGSPVLEEAVARIDCVLESVTEAGDHYIVLGRVKDLQLGKPRLPLIFFQGGYGRFTPASLTASDDHGQLTQQLRHLDRLRPELEALAVDLRCKSTVTARLGDELVILASAGRGDADGTATLVGQRLPFVPATGALFAAWDRTIDVEAWIGKGTDAATADRHRAAIELVRQRGYSLSMMSAHQRLFADMLKTASLGSETAPPPELLDVVRSLEYDPAEITDDVAGQVRQISAPVFDADGKVTLALTSFEFGHLGTAVLDSHVRRVRAAAEAATGRIGGRAPNPHS
jgi:flavin reductase (DIM6/NTAB) family NADH-FMN oxidoreductase RutF/DNA-binding IclR family transcriptional regulator